MFIEIYKKYIYSIMHLSGTISFPYEPTVAMGHSHFHVKVQKARKFGRLKASEKTNQWQKGKAPESCPSKERRGERWTLAWQVTSLNANIQPSPEVYLIFNKLLVDVAWSPMFLSLDHVVPCMHLLIPPVSMHSALISFTVNRASKRKKHRSFSTLLMTTRFFHFNCSWRLAFWSSNMFDFIWTN